MEKTYTILVVEDERPLLNAIKLKLEKSGFDVLTARSVDQAMGYLTDVAGIDVIWLDHYLFGKEDGLDLISKVKANDSQWKSIPVFVVSNTASPEKVQSYVSFGIEEYYVKAEHRLDEIIQDIRNYLSKHSA